MVSCAWSWLSVCGGSYSVMVVWDRFILVGGRCPWVLVVEGGVVVGDGGAVVVVFPHCPGVWGHCAKDLCQCGTHSLCMLHQWFCGGTVCWAPPLLSLSLSMWTVLW